MIKEGAGTLLLTNTLFQKLAIPGTGGSLPLSLLLMMAIFGLGVATGRLVVDGASVGFTQSSAHMMLAAGLNLAKTLKLLPEEKKAIEQRGVAALGLWAARRLRLPGGPLLLPLAMPAYVLAYAWTDALQFSGPLQTWLRGLTGAQGALWPDVRSLPFAIVLFVLCLYPYVYLLTRTALAERGVALMEAARLLGAGMGRRVREVALPLARPAVAAASCLFACCGPAGGAPRCVSEPLRVYAG